jgi:NADPH:quinone reductase-like Zn-dependent oxidoreductase
MCTELPNTMQAVVLRDYDAKPESIAVEEVPVPRPGPGQVLVRIAAAPVNPADLMFMRGLYGFKKTLPTTPGFEGGGTVVAGGKGLLPRLLLHRRVACAAAEPNINGGTWAQYLLTSAHRCIPLRREVNTEQGATMLINPLTAWALLEQARRSRQRAVVQTAAAGALGRMIVRLAHRFSLATINIVRRPEQEDLLRRLGARHVLNENAPEFGAALKDLCRTLGAGLAFDAVAGDLSARVLRALPQGGRLLVYGALSLKPPRLDPALLIFEGKRVEGFWLSSWLRSKNTLSLLRLAAKVQKLLAADLSTKIQARLPLTKLPHALQDYQNHMTDGKILFLP